MFLYDQNSCFSGHRPETKAVLFTEINRVKIFLSLIRPHSRMSIRIYIFNFQKKKKKKNKKTKKEKKKETTEETRISVENLTGYDDIV